MCVMALSIPLHNLQLFTSVIRVVLFSFSWRSSYPSTSLKASRSLVLFSIPYCIGFCLPDQLYNHNIYRSPGLSNRNSCALTTASHFTPVKLLSHHALGSLRISTSDCDRFSVLSSIFRYEYLQQAVLPHNMPERTQSVQKPALQSLP